MEPFSASLTLCEWNPSVTGGFTGQWRGALTFSLICTWTNGWSNKRDAGDLRCHRAHYDVTIMYICIPGWRKDMKMLSALLSLCEGNPPVLLVWPIYGTNSQVALDLRSHDYHVTAIWTIHFKIIKNTDRIPDFTYILTAVLVPYHHRLTTDLSMWLELK